MKQVKKGKNSQPSSLGLPTAATVDEDFLVCPECECSFFEEVTVTRYQRIHTVLLGQHIPTTNRGSFHLLRCAHCGQLVEPDYQMTADPLQNRYSQFLKEYEK